jgi:protein-tyrosine phosphatase
MFVCHGNICRSPMAEMILKDMVQKRGLSGRFVIASSATSTEEIFRGTGNPVYPAAREMLRNKGIPCGEHRAVRLRREDYPAYDHILAMDHANLSGISGILGGDPQQKVRRLLSFAGTPRDVADPWYSGDFETAYRDISRGCAAFLEYLEQEGTL